MTTDRLILVGWYRSPYARRVAITMHHHGLDYEHRSTNAWEGFEDVAAVNPIVKVPVLITETGMAIPDSTAILDYLDCRVGPERALMPPPSPLRDQARITIALAMAVIDKARELIQLNPDYAERWRGQISAALQHLDARAGDPHAAGERFTQADVTLGVMYDMVQRMYPDLLPRGRYPTLDRLAVTYHASPAFQATAPESD